MPATPRPGPETVEPTGPRPLSRRAFLQLSSLSLAATGALGGLPSLKAQEAGHRPEPGRTVTVLNPRQRVPLSFIIDDSTCLVNLAHFDIPQFAEVFPTRYRQDWRRLPRSIPDSFVRTFGEGCHEHGVKGKYSIVPNPACVGWVDRELPGWTKKELNESIRLVQNLMMPDWDLHPEMITHTWAIHTRTGRPYEERSERFITADLVAGRWIQEETEAVCCVNLPKGHSTLTL